MENNNGHSAIQTIVIVVIYIIVIALIIIGLFNVIIWGADKAMQRVEKAECERWAAEAKEYPNYYITGWQDEQCSLLGITIDAPIK